MKGEQQVREIFIANTIRLIAEGGFERATTKAITHSGISPEGVRMNEVYIYRLFGSKEQLYDVAFRELDEEFTYALRICIDSVGDITQNTPDKLWQIFCRVWHFVLRNENRCRCYVRYYYSVYFKGRVRAYHNKLFRDIAERFKPLFREDADCEAIMHSVLTSILDFAIRVYNGDIEDNPSNRPHIFNIMHCMMSAYFGSDIDSTLSLSNLTQGSEAQ